MTVLVSNVLLDIATERSRWAEWSWGALAEGRGGRRSAPLPDFYIGAHAAVAGFALLTRDASRYRTYFPTIELIAP